MLSTYEMIVKKRNGEALTTEEINFLINEYASEQMPDYQMAALAMAIYFQGMNERETADLTLAMVKSGDTVDLSEIPGVKADKHSTGGVGDKTTPVLAPWIAACGVPVAKMSGRGLGHTGGTIDKLASIPGLRTNLSISELVSCVNSAGVAIAGQNVDLVPADKKLYALRDVTGTVECPSLIAASVMSKKIASGADVIVLDVKVGSGAFMKTEDEATHLAREMVEIGVRLGRKVSAIVSRMEQPLGLAVGNAVEMEEAIEALKGSAPDDLDELCYALGAQMLLLSGRVFDENEGRELMRRTRESGAALDRFRQMIVLQGGDPGVLENYNLMPQPEYGLDVCAECDGWLSEPDALQVGLAARAAGAGRERIEDEIDLSAGIVLYKKAGDPVRKGDVLARIQGRDADRIEEAAQRMRSIMKVRSERLPTGKLICGVITV